MTQLAIGVWAMTTGVLVHGLALATPRANSANTMAVPTAISVSAMPLARW